MQRLKLLGMITLVACFAFSTSVALAKVNDDDDDAPVAKTHTAKAATKTKEKPGLMACPETIQVGAQDISKKIDGWHSFSDDAPVYALDTVTVYIDQKKTPAKLDPSKGTESFTEWQLLENGKEHYYMVCSYTHTSVLLKRELDKEFTTCRLSFENAAVSPGVPQKMHKMNCQ